MRFQCTFIVVSLLLSGFAAAQLNLNGYNLYARRSNAALRARNAAAELDYYNKLIVREAEAEVDAEFHTDLLARHADPEDDYLEDLVTRNADLEPKLDYHNYLLARDAYPEPDYNHDRVLFSRTPGNKGSKPAPVPDGKGKEEKKKEKPPQIPPIGKCPKCETVCLPGQNWCPNPVHKGHKQFCPPMEGQKYKRSAAPKRKHNFVHAGFHAAFIGEKVDK